MRITRWAAHYFTNPNSWHPVPERARILSAKPAIQPLPPVPMAPQSIQKTRETRRKHLLQQCVSSLLFVSLVLTCLYIYVCPWSKFNERKSLPWLMYVIRARLWKLPKWTISSFWWKEINSRPTVTSTNQCCLKKSSPTGKAPLSLGNGLRQNYMIGIGRYRPSGLRD